jgi:hypothetical protein
VEFEAERLLIDSFLETGTQLPMNGVEAPLGN